MLQSLHVKNLALMEETEIQFKEGLNILTGETGAGKSLLIGSVNLALGAKFEKEMLRKDCDTALVELEFSGNRETEEKLKEMDLDVSDDGTVFLSRKMQVGKSVYRINGETVTAKQVKELAGTLIDIHGQHEHQSLLHKKKHLEILDEFCGDEISEICSKVKSAYNELNRLEKQMEEEKIDPAARQREMSLAEFELQEILDAGLSIGEDETLDNQYRKMVNGKKIAEGLQEALAYAGNEEDVGAGNGISRAIRAMGSISGFDPLLEQLEGQLAEVDDLLSGFCRDAGAYLRECDFSEETFRVTEDRLNQINRLKDKYGRNIEEVLAYADEKQKLLDKFADYEAYMEGLKKNILAKKEELLKLCGKLSAIRKKNAKLLGEKLRDALVHLNFLTVQFEVAVSELEKCTEKGMDDVEFMISVNPGESMKSLSQAASGGELSRIMLAIKTVLAGRDEIDTLIFDEIDAGISGITAWKVSEQLHLVAKEHQVICITHLPQIAAMSDAHYVIEKSSTDNHTITDVRMLKENESLGELARLLGSDALTEAALTNADELRKQALSYKSNL